MVKRVLAVTLAGFALANLARAILAAQHAIQLPDLPTATPAPYLVWVGMVWAIGFGACAYGIARSRRWAPRVTIAAIVLYQANLWLNHLAFARSSESFAREGFGLVLGALSIVVIGGAAWWCDRRFATDLPNQLSTLTSNSERTRHD